MSTDQKTNVPAWPEELKDGPADQEEPKKDTWTPDEWFADPVKDEAARKEEIKIISNLINNLVMYVSLKAGKYDKDFPGLPVIRAEMRTAKNKAIRAMKELLKSWDVSTG